MDITAALQLESPEKSVPVFSDFSSLALAVDQILTVAVRIAFSGTCQIIFDAFDQFCFVIGFFSREDFCMHELDPKPGDLSMSRLKLG